MQNSADALRRWLGMLCLALASGMLIWGRTLLQPFLRSWLFVLYWCVCVAFAVAAVGIGTVDLIAMRRHYHRQHQRLIQRVLGRLERLERRRRKLPARTSTPVQSEENATASARARNEAPASVAD